MAELGPPLAERNGFVIHELFVRDAEGGYISIGFGIFDPEGRLVQVFTTLEEALEQLEEYGVRPEGRGPRP